MVAVLGAMKSEIKEMLSHIETPETHEWRERTFVTGNLAGRAVVLAGTGVGKVMAAVTAQRIIDLFSPSHVVFTGIAGALKPDLQVGDIVLARDCVQWDMDVTYFGFKRGKIPFTSYRFIPGDPLLLERAASFKPDAGRIHTGRVVTGDRFISDAARPEYAFLSKELAGTAVEMEGASVALTAHINGIPCLITRIISDAADGIHPLKFRKILKNASRTSFQLVSHILAGI